MLDSRVPLGFSEYSSLLKQHWKPALITGLFLFGFISLSNASNPAIYIASGKLRFVGTDPTSTLTGVGEETGKLESLLQEDSPLETEAEVIRSHPLIERTIVEVNLLDKSGQPLSPTRFLENLDVVKIKATDILEISYRHNDANRATEIVNMLMSLYLEQNRENQQTQAVKARRFIEQQLPSAEAEVNLSELALQRFRETNRIVDLSSESATSVDAMTELRSELTRTRAKLADRQAQAADLSAKIEMSLPEALVAADLSQSDGIQETLNQLQQVEFELAEERARFRDGHPTIRKLENLRNNLSLILQDKVRQMGSQSTLISPSQLQISDLKQELTRQAVLLDSQQEGLIAQLNELEESWNLYAQRSQLLPSFEAEQRQLEHQLEAAQSTYSQMLQKISELRIAENQSVGNVQVLAQATRPEKPSSDTILPYLVAGLCGVMGAGAVVYILARLEPSVSTIEQARGHSLRTTDFR